MNADTREAVRGAVDLLDQLSPRGAELVRLAVRLNGGTYDFGLDENLRLMLRAQTQVVCREALGRSRGNLQCPLLEGVGELFDVIEDDAEDWELNSALANLAHVVGVARGAAGVC